MNLRVNPTAARVEATPACQLRCPSCPTASGATKPLLGRGYLKAVDLERLLANSPQIRHVELSNYGELFLNPELLEIMAIAHGRGVTLSAQNGANLNTVKPDVLEGLVKYGFRTLTVSIDGVTQQTYQQYRVGGDLDVVLGNIRSINAHKQRYQSPLPLLVWQFIIFGFNEHEIEQAAMLAASLGMKFRVKLAWGDFSPVKDVGRIRKLLGHGSRVEYQQQHGVEYMSFICNQLWDEPQINSDGKVLGCCRNFWMEFGGNAIEEGLEAVMNSEKMEYARQMLTGAAPQRDDIPCTTCSVYISRRTSGNWIKRAGAQEKAHG